MNQPPVAANAPKPLKPIYAKLEGIEGNEPEARRRQDALKRCRVGESVVLSCHPEKGSDPPSVEVRRSTGEVLGFLSDDMSERIGWRLDRGSQVDATLTSIGGGNRWLLRRGPQVTLRLVRYDMRQASARKKTKTVWKTLFTKG